MNGEWGRERYGNEGGPVGRGRFERVEGEGYVKGK